MEPRKLALEVVVAEAIAITVGIEPVSIILIASAKMITMEATIASRIAAIPALLIGTILLVHDEGLTTPSLVN